MADMTITGDAKFGSIVTEMKKVEKASDSMKRKVDRMSTGAGTPAKSGYQRPGMGLLELSRGVEDFAVAGMRGLLNNIPGIIMSFGGTMGLAAVVSLSAVAVTVLGKGLLDLATNAKENKIRMQALAAANEKFASGVRSAAKKLENFREQQRKAAAEARNEARMEEKFRRFGDPVGIADRQAEQTKEERAALESILSLREKLAEIGGAEKPNRTDIIGNAEEDAAASKVLIENLIKQRAQVEREMEKATIAGMGDFGAIVHDLETAIAFAQKEAERHKANMEANKGRPLYEAASRTLMEIEERKIEALNLEMESLTAKDSFRNKELAALSEKIKAIDLEIQGAERSEDAAKMRLSYIKQEEELRKKIEERSALNSERNRFGEALLKEINKQVELMGRFAEIDSVLANTKIGGGDMLSSSGRIGGSVSEYNSAIATINYQRDTLSELRKIARNTARKQDSTYK